MNNKLRIIIFLQLCFATLATITAQDKNNIDIGVTNSIKCPSLNYYRPLVGIQANDSLRDKIIFNTDYLYRQSVIASLSKYNYTSLGDNEPIYYFTLNKLKLSPYEQRVINWGLGDINNTGVALHWSPFNKLSVEARGFLSMQYGYILFSKSATYGASLKLNYELNNKLNFYVWGQYMFNRNNDPFLKYMYTQPKTGLGLGIEYKPTQNMNIGISAGKQEDIIDKGKYNITIEGKAGLKF
ncbi:MAG: hypothetical protein LBR26_04895 [Prevotella sp.]|jgi:hypothetical protein|nr:hypothetical protein [Prevotella sp.]